jgi:hypothetical protein
LTTTFRVDLRNSSVLAAAAAVGHLAALAGAWLVLPGPAIAVVAAGLGLSIASLFRSRAQLPAALLVGPGSQIRLVDRHGEVQAASVSGARVPVWWMAILALETASGRRTVLCLLPDSAAADALRRLRAWMLGPVRRGRSEAPGNATQGTRDPRSA